MGHCPDHRANAAPGSKNLVLPFAFQDRKSAFCEKFCITRGDNPPPAQPIAWQRRTPPYSVRLMSDLFASGAAATARQLRRFRRSRCSKGSSPSAAAPACISAGPTRARSTTSPPRSSTISMDEAVAGHASRIEVTLEPGNRLTVTDNGRGIPVDPHPKYPGKSALEVILTTLHSGGKFEGKAYSTSGGLHGVGVSVVNALSTETIVEVAREKKLYRQTFAQGHRHLAARGSRRRPQPPRHDRQLRPRPRDLRRRRGLRPRAALQARPLEGLSVRRGRDPLALRPVARQRRGPRNRRLPIPRRPRRPSREQLEGRECVTSPAFAGRQDFPDAQGSAEWAVAWPLWSEGGERKLLLQHHPDPRRRHA